MSEPILHRLGDLQQNDAFRFPPDDRGPFLGTYTVSTPSFDGSTVTIKGTNGGIEYLSPNTLVHRLIPETAETRHAGENAVLLRALIAGVARWEPFNGTPNLGEVCFDGMRYSAKVGDDGIPRMHGMFVDRLQALLARINGAKGGGE